jgi:molecular chaperone GrpE (heat shock protein)
MKIKGLVTDRAKALIKLGEEEYLGVFSMPDLFHFSQELAKAVGAKIGKKRKKAADNLLKSNNLENEELNKECEQVNEIYKKYRQEIEQINKTVHPFNEMDIWAEKQEIEKELLHCFTRISHAGQELGIEIELSKAQKILKQIEPISEGVERWIEETKVELAELESKGKINQKEQEWLSHYALPYNYWKIQLGRTTSKKVNQDLRAYYKERVSAGEIKCKSSSLDTKIPVHRLNELLQIGHKIALSFQRSSSQVEGRNGYLSFVNHGHKGFPKDRLKVLTVIHNYDIKRVDGSTPAQRLFGKEFPNLFEFLCHNVTGFKEPRKRKKAETLGSIIVQR